MSEHLLDVRDLRVSFDTYAGEVQAVRGISFHLDRGETLAIVGESGCGKSVSMQTMMRLLPMPPARLKDGQILFEGKDLAELTDKEMEDYRGKEFAMIFQDSMTSLNPTMRVGNQMCEGIMRHQKVSKDEAKKIAIDMLSQVGIPNPEAAFRRYPHTMSGGQRQRVMIAMALACRPELIIADEPTTALDVTVQQQILALLRELREDLGASSLLITHDLGVIAQNCDRVIVMYAGRIVESAPVEELFANPRHAYTKALLAAMPRREYERKTMLPSIPGHVASIRHQVKGCRFCQRMGVSVDLLTDRPPMVEIAPGHRVEACPRCFAQSE